MSDPNNSEIAEIFLSIDKKLSLNLAETISQEEISRVIAYYTKEKIRFNQDQSQFIKPGKRKTTKQIEILIMEI